MLVTRLNCQGDTIVEVLMCLVVLGSALGVSYSVAGQSTQSTRRAQERSQALVYTQSKLEEFKAAYSSSAGSKALYDSRTASERFCSDLSLSGASPTYYWKYIPTTDLYSASHPNNCQSSTGITYMTAIQRDITTSPATFVITTRWARLGSGNQETLSLRYRP